MSFTQYSPTSPYSQTSQTSWYLDKTNIISIPRLSTDFRVKLQKKYENRPDLLAYDLYGTSKLWWVFSVRNPNIISDPIFGMIEGIEIFTTKKEDLFELING